MATAITAVSSFAHVLMGLSGLKAMADWENAGCVLRTNDTVRLSVSPDFRRLGRALPAEPDVKELQAGNPGRRYSP
jgi:hypothetical protein